MCCSRRAGNLSRGIEIGSVRSVTSNSNTLIKEITVEPSVDLNSLRKVSGFVMRYWKAGIS
ncbi:MAG: rod shape-determining protein MreC [Anaerovoracaceae bacterium]